MARRKSRSAAPSTARERIAAKVNKSAGRDVSGIGEEPWHEQEEPHLAVFSDAERIGRVTSGRRLQDLYLACLYDDEELAALVGGTSLSEYTPQTLSTNIVKRQIDAFTTRMTKNRPLPMPLTTGGNYSQQRQAKSLGKFFEGVLDQVNYWPVREQRIRDAGLWGSGFAYNYRVGGKLYHDRFFGWEVEVDPREAMYGTPRTFRLKRYVDTRDLIRRFPDKEEEIREAQRKDPNDRWHVGWDDTCDLRLVRGIWRTASDESADDGDFALCVSNATLLRGKYKWTSPPFSKIDVLPALVGWRGQGIAKNLIGLQYEVNAIGMRMQEQGYMTGSYLLVEDGAGIETDTLDNGIATVVRYRGTKPEWHNPPPWHPAFFEWYMFLRGRAPAEESRMSEQATRGEKPPGLDSGAAVRAWKQLDDDAYVPAGRSDERDVINTSWQFFDLLEEIQAERGDEKDERKPYSVRVESREHGRSMVKELDFAKVRLAREQFILRTFPTSFLRGTPEEQIQMTRELIDSGFLSQDEALALIDFPDLQRVLNLRGGARRNIERLLERIKDSDSVEEAKKNYEYPVAAWNLELCKALGLMCYLDAKLDGVEDGILKQILQFAIDAQGELDKAAAGTSTGAGQAALDANADPNALEGQPMPLPGEPQFMPPPEPVPPEAAVMPEAMPMIPGAP